MVAMGGLMADGKDAIDWNSRQLSSEGTTILFVGAESDK